MKSSHPPQDKTPQAGQSNLPTRHRIGAVWLFIFQASTIIGFIALAALMYTVINKTFGYVAVQYKVDPETLVIDGTPLEEMSQAQLITVLEENTSKGRYRQLNRETPVADRTREEIYQLVIDEALEPQVEQTWTLVESLFERETIKATLAEEHPKAKLQFTSWIDPEFITHTQSDTTLEAGVRTALLGSLWTIAITIAFAFPIGVSAAIYLEEYATDNFINRIIQTNINNLAGVPSIIYGMLGLAIFARTLEPLTSGAIFGATDPTTANGRTILSAGLTLGLLILPVIIINGQEAIRAVTISLRRASYGLGATKWQTIWYHVLPNSIPGILTGTILAISRAIGETAPLVVVGASTYIVSDPSGPFAKFTTLPIQIYQWTSRPQADFRNIAAAAILVLLILLLSLNASAIVLRNRFSRK